MKREQIKRLKKGIIKIKLKLQLRPKKNNQKKGFFVLKIGLKFDI